MLGQMLLSVIVVLAIAKASAATREAETAQRLGGAGTVSDGAGTTAVVLAAPGQGMCFAGMPSAKRLAVCYASVDVGTITVVVEGQRPRKINIHSSGSATASFLHAIIELNLPTGASLTLLNEAGDAPVAIARIIVGDVNLGLPPDIWNLPPLPVTAGPYPADWKGLAARYSVPAWWREAKFGVWAHWDPQSMPEKGDWYARSMYLEGDAVNKSHSERFGHPSEYGYKDICNDWKIDRWNPEQLMDLFAEMGARYFMAMGVHHDNFDCWDSAFQPWNAVRVGPKCDIVATWAKVARAKGLRFGIGFHNSPGRTWGQFMPVRYTSDKQGPKRGVPYDALQTIVDGKGKWWEGMDPVDLYGPKHGIEEPLKSPYANQFMWRVDDAITKYHPDVIYFDEHAGDSLVDLNVHMGLGFLAPQLVANYYNKSLAWNGGKMDVVINLKGVGGKYNSFRNSPELLPLVDRALVKSTEAHIEPEIMAEPFQTEVSSGAWHYSGPGHKTANEVVSLLVENVCRNGTLLLNITQHGRGDLDPSMVQMCKDVGSWLKINGEAIYGSRPFEISGENDARFTRANGNLYGILMNWGGGPVTLKALGSGGATLGKISKVELVGANAPLSFVQEERGLTITPGASFPVRTQITDKKLASEFHVLRITHDRRWINDDDPGTCAIGWRRKANLGTGDYNNDLTISDKIGSAMTYVGKASTVAVVCPKEPGAGKIEVQVDGKSRGIYDLSTGRQRLPQQRICVINDLSPSSEHAITVINRAGTVAVDAFIPE